MGKDFDNFSTLDWWNSADGADYLCSQGYGTLISHYGRGLNVSLGTAVQTIDYSGGPVRIHTTKGTIEAKSAIVTVSTGVVSSQVIKFVPQLPQRRGRHSSLYRWGTMTTSL